MNKFKAERWPQVKPEKIKLRELSEKVDHSQAKQLIEAIGTGDENDPRLDKYIEQIDRLASTSLKNRDKFIDVLYGTQKQKGLLEEGDNVYARMALSRILEAEIPISPKRILITKEIELLAGIKGINSRSDLDKIEDVAFKIPVTKIAKFFKTNPKYVNEVISFLTLSSEGDKKVMKEIYEIEMKPRERIRKRDLAPFAVVGARWIEKKQEELLNYMGLIKSTERMLTKINYQKIEKFYKGKIL